MFYCASISFWPPFICSTKSIKIRQNDGEVGTFICGRWWCPYVTQGHRKIFKSRFETDANKCGKKTDAKNKAFILRPRANICNGFQVFNPMKLDIRGNRSCGNNTISIFVLVFEFYWTNAICNACTVYLQEHARSYQYSTGSFT